MRTWKCRFLDKPPGKENEQPGDMWYVPWYVDKVEKKPEESIKTFLSREYWEDHFGKRAPLCVVLPNGHHWIVDSRASNIGNNRGWKVTGEAPNITCHPSIGMGEGKNYFHGWLQNGILREC